MRSVSFRAFGHENVVGDHRTTLEVTSEGFLTPQGTCIIGIRSELTLDRLEEDIKAMARLEKTEIRFVLTIDDMKEEIVGHGSPGLTYSDRTSMVVRTSSFECPRTLMINADKAAINLGRDFIEKLRNPKQEIICQIVFTMR
ncbi:MAG: DUF371 domain-containing protein [Candidatus Thorarchaeota archaeon]